MQTRRTQALIQSLRNADNDTSDGNKFSNLSKSMEISQKFGGFKDVTRQDGNRLVLDIVKSIFDEKSGVNIASSSRCSIPAGFEGSEDMDKRLKRWHDTLRDRARLQTRICDRIGRQPEQMLFNLPGSLEQRNKHNLIRVMDYAERMNPTQRKLKQYGVLRAKCDAKTCVCLTAVRQTVPAPERSDVVELEISGLCNTTEKEIFGPKKRPTAKTDWINSERLEKRIAKKAKDIGRVLNFCPDVPELEVIGSNFISVPEHIEDINLIQVNSLYSISSITGESSTSTEQLPPVESLELEPKVFNVGLKINDNVYVMDTGDRMYSSVSYEFSFECSPFERQFKQVLRLENIGRRIFFCEWLIYEMPGHMCGHCFFFQHNKFKMFPGEVHMINVMFQPRAVFLSRQRWTLRMFPQLFCNRRNSLTLILVGKSVAPPEYLRKLDKQLNQVIEKSQKVEAQDLTHLHAELVPLIEPNERLCPYERAFDEREQFNVLNCGYHCERFDDIEALRRLYNGIKMPRDPPWDLRLDTIKRLIMRQSEIEKREIYFQDLLDIQETLCCSNDQSLRLYDHISERERSCFIYVRGCIGSGIEEWEDLMMSVEESCFKTELTSFYKSTWKDSVEEKKADEDATTTRPWLLKLKREQPRHYVHRMMLGKKYFIDALYMQTYTQLCNIAENVVSVIESTQYI